MQQASRPDTARAAGGAGEAAGGRRQPLASQLRSHDTMPPEWCERESLEIELDTGAVIKEELNIGAAVLQPEVKLEWGTEDWNDGTMSDQVVIKIEPVEECSEPVAAAVLVKQELVIHPIMLEPNKVHYLMADPKQEPITDELTEESVGGGTASSSVEKNMSYMDCNSGSSKIGQFERPHSCDVCDKKFVQKSHLIRHMLTHTDEQPHSCEVCNKVFVMKSSLIRHMLTHTGERPYSCEVCSNTFALKSNLNAHLITHTGERPHTCEVCKKAFFYKSQLKRHMITHTDNRLHSCDVCDKKFMQKSHLNTHMITHTGEQPHSCDICHTRFALRSSLIRHMITHTGERSHSCDLCDKKFIQKSHLNTHMITHTGERP